MTISVIPQFPQHEVLAVLERHWGYTTLRPLQQDAIMANLQGRESLVVLPTGGGKSLCYQVPAALDCHTHIVVSPLIALMKDQVDGLRQCGISAAALNSSMSASEQLQVEQGLLSGQYRLLYVAPERLLMPRVLELLVSVHGDIIFVPNIVSSHSLKLVSQRLVCMRLPQRRLNGCATISSRNCSWKTPLFSWAPLIDQISYIVFCHV